MASFKCVNDGGRDRRQRRYRFFWRLAGVQYNAILAFPGDRAAEAKCAEIESTLALLKEGRLTLPEGDRAAKAFVLSGGRQTSPLTPPARPMTVADVWSAYEATVQQPAVSTRKTYLIHIRHLCRIFGNRPVASIDTETANDYIVERSREEYRGRAVRPATASGELATLLTVWTYVANRRKSLGLRAPTWGRDDLDEAKRHEPLRFRTVGEVEASLARGGLNEEQTRALWEAVFLDEQQIMEVLSTIRNRARVPWLVPMTFAAAYTGARRSELCRSRVEDWRLKDGMVAIRERKRDKSKEFTFRDVPVHSKLAEEMRRWFEGPHPGGPWAFAPEDARAFVSDQDGDGAISVWMAHDHLSRTLTSSVWEFAVGWHTFRHSFASNLARHGTAESIIDSFMGHHTEIRKRYRHLFPTDRSAAIALLD